MTDSIRDAHEHGILDQDAATIDMSARQIVDRRRFLAQLGAGALGAAFLNFRNPTAGFATAFPAPVITGGSIAAAARPIYMVALGDSIMWGQGLDDHQKFQSKIASWIQSTHPDKRPVKRWNFAHSGATLGGLRGLTTPEVPHATAEMTAAVFGKTATTKRGREYADLPDFSPRAERIDARANPETEPFNELPPAGPPTEPPDGDRMGGEIPRAYPSLWRQLELARVALRTGRDPRYEFAAQMQPVDLAEVDLVLCDGGANDVDFLSTIVNPWRDSQQTYDHVRAVVEPRIKEYLPRLLETFPNATVILTTTYQGISNKSSAAALAPLVEFLSLVARINLPAHAIVAGKVIDNQIGALIGRNDAMERAITDAYRAAVASAPAGRVHIVRPEFAPENAYGAPQSFLFHVEQADPAENRRIAECDALLGQWITGQQRTTSALWALCRDANTFHPNVAGANHYFTKIRDTLVRASPAFMRALPKLRVVVNGSAAGDTKTVTVTAFDAQSGQSVNGSVAIAGVTGQTGAPISFKANACAVTGGVATDVGAGPGPVVRRPVGRGGVARAPVAAAASTCNGRVMVNGYSEGTFRY